MHDASSKRLASPAAGLLAMGTFAVLAGGCELRERDWPRVEADRTQVQRGQRLLSQYQCGSCHTIPGVVAAQGQAAAPLAAFGRRSYIAGYLPNRPDTLARWIVEPVALVPDTAMPAMGVSAGDARDMVAYLMTLE